MTAADTDNSRDVPALETVCFTGLQPGPKLIVTGAVHGNETCGPEAIHRAIADCRSGRIAIRRGQVTFLPITNAKAYGQGTRAGDRNLNRDLRERAIPSSNEDLVGNLLCGLLRQHDVLLDIHSFRSRGEPFVFAGPPDNDGPIEPFRLSMAEGDFARRLGPKLIMRGWLPAYFRAAVQRGSDLAEGIGTTEYMRSCGGYGVTLECGQHSDPAAPEVAYQAILRALSHLRLTDGEPPAPTVERAIEIVDVALCHSADDRLAREWITGDPVKSGEPIGIRKDGTHLVAPSDGFVIFPDANARPGSEWFYFGVAGSLEASG
jgi:predicted deacylase